MGRRCSSPPRPRRSWTEFALRDLGEHRFKDLAAAERVFQLGSDEFPPLKTLFQTNLPVPATPFLGRDRELGEVGELLARTRLLTLTGPGGGGKTRLALQAAGAAADEYPQGVWWVPLAAVVDPASILDEASRSLGAPGELAATIGDRRLLLVLDNFEHLIDAAPALSELLAGCPNLDLLVTSRERLRIAGENVYPVPVLARAEARELFSTRARAVSPDFTPDAMVDLLCERLDDLPLALELAAARTVMLSSEQLLERLGSRLDLLRGGRDAESRQQTLRATIEWSHDLLELGRAAPLRPARRLRGGLHARGGRGGLRRRSRHAPVARREEPRPRPGRGPVLDARDDPRARAGTAGRIGGGGGVAACAYGLVPRARASIRARRRLRRSPCSGTSS